MIEVIMKALWNEVPYHHYSILPAVRFEPGTS